MKVEPLDSLPASDEARDAARLLVNAMPWKPARVEMTAVLYCGKLTDVIALEWYALGGRAQVLVYSCGLYEYHLERGERSTSCVAELIQKALIG